MSPSTPTPDVNESPNGFDAAASSAPSPSAEATTSALDAVPAATGEMDDGRARGEEVEIESVIDRETVRRAPKYKAFFLTGALAGIVLGLIVGIAWMSSPASSGVLKPGVYLTVVVLGTTTLTTLVAGALAIWADKRSLRR